ncbi:54S ribosomal protein L44, mitochondrial [[Candida] anglica]|uniref:Large ribosomal subunit protein mL53 n=1 Tax=[Candida] anglica TaxID=148631 RepID=A0ABP0E750_9ASCO
MITKYFTKVTVKFDPFAPSARPARLFLARIPPSLKGQCTVNHKILTATSPSTEKPTIEVTFKDKEVLKADPTKLDIKELIALFDSHSRKLVIKDSITV